MNTDPTLQILGQLKDPSLWHVVRNVPIFVPHVRLLPDGSEKYRATREDLDTIVANMDFTEQTAGVPPRLQIGHTKPGAPQAEQPKTVGYVLNRKVGTWGPANEEGILGDYYIRKDKLEQVKDLPFRSAEYYRRRNTISAVALLAEDPELDLGLITYSRGEHEPECYSLGKVNLMPEKAPEQPDLTKLIAEGIEAYMRSKETTPPPAPSPDSTRMLAEDQAIQLSRQQDTIAKLEKELEVERYHRRESVAERHVIQLQAEGYQIKSREKLVKKLASMTEEQAAIELAEIRESYARVPVETGFIRTASAPPSSATKEQCDAAVSLASAKSISFDEALNQVRSK